MPGYVKCMETCGMIWLGLKFIFPLIWWPDRDYESTYRMKKKAKRDCRVKLITSNGFLQIGERIESSFNLSIFHIMSLKFD